MSDTEEAQLKEEEKVEEGEDEGLNELQELEETLDKVQINPSNLHISEQKPLVDQSECPASYSKNTSEENLFLSRAENLQAQYSYLYLDRKPLLLCPVNEFGVQKFVSTTLRKTLLPYAPMFDWQGCASFVSDFLTLELLDHPTELPKQLCSPTYVVRSRKGRCFEYSTLLCSFLLGAGFNAYCVSGYAVKEMCLLDQRHDECPPLKPQDTAEQKPPEQKENVMKYKVVPPRELKSTFEQHQEERKQQERQALLEKQQKAERLKEEQERPVDPLHGQRVHSWVLVLAGKRDITENFFIDPLSGLSYPTSSACFLGIESVWNNENYWINMQDCRLGCTEMKYNLQDVRNWEYMLYSPCSVQGSSDANGEEMEEQIDEDINGQELVQMPLTWVKNIHISKEDIGTRYPGGSKVIYYRKAMLEKFTPYLQNDGLVTRLTTYDDLQCTQVDMMKEWYENRHDELQEREVKKDTSITTERFSSGRNFSLKTHRYGTTETERLMEFYSKARDDNLLSRVVTPTEMTETFQGRSDLLYYRHVSYGPSELTQQFGVQRPIQNVEVRFHRNQSKPANKDVAEITFRISHNKIEVSYHLEDDRIVPDFHIFKKPPNSQEPFTDQMVSSFQVDPYAKPFSKLYLYHTLMELMNKEEEVLISIKLSEKEVKNILEIRDQEESIILLKISMYDMARNVNACLHVEKLRQEAREKELMSEYECADVLAPILAHLGDPEIITKELAVQIHTDCLNNLKQKLIDRANLIQARYEKETQELLQKQQWYQKNKLNLTAEDEEEYLTFCSETMFRINTLKRRLNRYKDTVPQKYLALDKMLKQDPRLMQHLD